LALAGCRVTARTATPATSSASTTAAPSRTGITVDNIQPGPTATDMKPDDGGDFADHMRSLTAVGHYGHPATSPAPSPTSSLIHSIGYVPINLGTPGRPRIAP
jgi:NAD(P)-dependent dehydrogenase (short-subunit alcohol dehydrogenase family)